MSLKRTTAPTDDVITLADAKSHLRVDHSDEDTLIQAYLDASVDYAENVQARSLAKQTWTLKLPDFPGLDGAIQLLNPPVRSVTSIQYVDTDGNTQTLAASNYTVLLDEEPGLIVPAFNQTWPDTRSVPDAVTVVYVAGYPDDGGSPPVYSIPAKTKAGILMVLGDLYQNREMSILGTIRSDNPAAFNLLYSERVSWL